MKPDSPPQNPAPDLPDLAALQQAMAAREAARQSGGDPAALDALACLRSQVVEGVTLYANPAATYCALRLIRSFFPVPEPGKEEEVEIDQLAAMAYSFAEPVPAYLAARRGSDAYLTAVFAWTQKHFTGGDANYRLGRVAGWCAGVLQTLDALNPRTPAETVMPPAVPVVSPPAPTPDSSPL